MKKESEMENEYVPQNEEIGKVETEKTGVTLAQLGHMIYKHWVAAVVCLLLGLAAGVGYSKFIKTPKYQSTVQLMVKESGSEDADENIASAKTKAGIAKIYLGLDEVATEVGKRLGEKGYEVYSKDASGEKIVNTSLVEGYYTVDLPVVTGTNTSLFLTVTSTCKTAQMAIDVANCVADTAVYLANTTTSTAYSYLKDSIVKMESANSAKDTSTSTFVFAAVGALAGLVVGAAYGIIRELANTKVSSKVELEAITGYKVIGMIPKYENTVEQQEGGKDNA